MKRLTTIFFKAMLCGVLPFAMLLGGVPAFAYTGNATKELTSGADIRVMSYNVLVDNDESLGGWSWGKPLADRGDKASAAIDYYRPDVIGFQECNYKWHVSLRENLPDYDFVNADVPEDQELEKSDSLGKKDWMCTTMMYNTKTLTLIDNELVGYSCNYWGCIQRMRYISMALFEVKSTGERFVFTSTHLDAEQDAKGQGMRRTQADELANRILHYMDTYGYPVISTGDYNSSYEDTPISTIRKKTGMISPSKNRGGIDYILFSAGLSSKYFTVVNDADLGGASDHQPIFADFELKGEFRFSTTATTTTKKTTTTTTTTTTKKVATGATTKAEQTTTAKTTTAKAEITTTSAAKPVATAPAESADTTATTTVSEDTAIQEDGAITETTADSTTETEIVTEMAEDTTTSAMIESTTAATEASQPTEATPVKKKNHAWLYIGIAAGVVLIGGGAAAFFLLRKKK